MMLILWHGVLVSIVLELGSSTSPSTALRTEDLQDQRDLVEFLLNGNQAYYDSFPYLTAKFRVTRGYAKTLTDGLEGRWLPETEPLVCHCFWAFDGENEIRRDEYLRDDVAKHPSAVTQHALRKGSLLASYQPGQIFHIQDRSAAPPYFQWYQPLNFGRNAPLHEAVRFIRGQPGGSVSYEGEKDLDGKQMHVLKMDQSGPGPNPHHQTDRFWIDPIHGYVPVRIETFIDEEREPRQLFVVTEFQKIKGERWIPCLFRNLILEIGGRMPGLALTEMALDEVDADRKPAAAVFELQVAKGVNGSNEIRHETMRSRTGRLSLSSFRPDGTLVDEHGDFEMTPTRSRVNEGVRPPPDGAESLVPTWPFATAANSKARWLWTILGVFSIILAGVLFVRYWRRAS